MTKTVLGVLVGLLMLTGCGWDSHEYVMERKTAFYEWMADREAATSGFLFKVVGKKKWPDYLHARYSPVAEWFSERNMALSDYAHTRTPGRAPNAGVDGTNGTSCTVEPQSEGALITCEDGTTAFVEYGEDGTDGTNGVDGTNGTDGLAGPAGADGVDGQDGATGATGPAGKDGLAGADGLDGAPGQDGKDGAPGQDGKDGPKGDKGDKGDRGPRGPKGKSGK